MRDKSRQAADDKAYTITHFVEIARQNRFAENGAIPHDSDRCLVCHPERCGGAPFLLYLEVIRESVKVRRPRLDEELVAAINGDLELLGVSVRVSREALLARRPEAVSCWRDWLRDALDTGLGLLSVHSRSSLEFSLEEAEEEGWAERIEQAVQDLMHHQLRHRVDP